LPGALASAFGWLAFVAIPSLGIAQEVERQLTFDEALDVAMHRNVDLRIAEANEAAAAAGASSASAFLWPQVVFSSGLVRSNDPVFAFGTKLRQGVFGEPDFAIDELNDPDPLTNWTAGIDVRWEILAPTRWAQRSVAREQANASTWGMVRRRETIRLHTRTLYLDALTAEGRHAAARATERAARATLERFERRKARGMLTEADRLQAEAEFEMARASSIDASRREREARQALGAFLGWSVDSLPVPSETLSAPADLTPSDFDPTRRADILALGSAVRATHASGRGAMLAYVPALEAFGNVKSHADEVFESDSDDWSVGVALRWTAFGGLQRKAELDRARAAELIARLQFEHATREALREVDAAKHAVDAARAGYEASLAARVAVEDATRLIQRRFEEGLATPDELLQAEARLATIRSRAVDALAAWNLAVAHVEFVRATVNGEEVP
jgi:outer membrane protein TolC